MNIQQAAANQVAVMIPGGGDRVTQQAGSTALKSKGNMTIYYNAELKPVGCCTKVWLCLFCRAYDNKRSYLYLRENSIETNIASNPMCCGAPADYVSVTYFDRAPFKPYNQCLCCCKTDPKLEITKPGCTICCIPCTCCTQEKVVIMPAETLYGCCSNRVTRCDNCCGLLGLRTGAPKKVQGFEPQPKDPAQFVACAQQIMSRN